MRAAKITFFIILTAIITIQTISHFYVKFLDPRKSILDKYKKDVEKKIDGIKSLDELESLYAEQINDIDNLEKNRDKYTKDQYDDMMHDLEQDEQIIYYRIKTIESKQKDLKQLIFYWSAGLLLVAIGIVIYILRFKWIGLTLFFLGFGEFATWTSPLMRWDNLIGFKILLDTKLILSLISLLLIITVWIINEKLIDKE